MGGYDDLTAALGKTRAEYEATMQAMGGSGIFGTLKSFFSNPLAMFDNLGKNKGLIEGYQQMEMLSDAAAQLAIMTGKSADEMVLWLRTQVEAGVVIPDAATAVAIYTGKIDENALGAENAATAQDGYAESIRNAANALKATTDPYFAVLDAQGNLNEAQKKYNELSANGKKRTAESDAAYIELVKSGLALQGALSEVGAAQAEGSASTESFSAAMESLRAQGIDPSTEAGKALIEKIYGVGYGAILVAAMLKENPINPQVQQAQVDAFLANLQKVREEWRTTRNFLLKNPIGTEGSGLGVFRVFPPTSASGGFLPQGRPTLVGELGPELFIPSSSGTVMTSLSTANALDGRGGGGVNIAHLSVELPNVTNGDQLVDELQRYIRRNGPLPLAVA